VTPSAFIEWLSLKDHPELNERWVQDRIAEDPSLLGLGDVVLKDKERRQPHAARIQQSGEPFWRILARGPAGHVRA
jgi:hypothetical protein